MMRKGLRTKGARANRIRMAGAIGGAAGGEGQSLGGPDEEATGADPQHSREHQKLSRHDISFRENGVQKVGCAIHPSASRPSTPPRRLSEDVAPSSVRCANWPARSQICTVDQEICAADVSPGPAGHPKFPARPSPAPADRLKLPADDSPGIFPHLPGPADDPPGPANIPPGISRLFSCIKPHPPTITRVAQSFLPAPVCSEASPGDKAVSDARDRRPRPPVKEGEVPRSEEVTVGAPGRTAECAAGRVSLRARWALAL